MGRLPNFYSLLNALQIILFSYVIYLCILDIIYIMRLTTINIFNKLILSVFILFLSLYIFQFIGYLDKLMRSLFLYNLLPSADYKDLILFPKTAIIIPAFNESALILERTIDAASKIKYNNYELLQRECGGSRIPQPSGWG